LTDYTNSSALVETARLASVHKTLTAMVIPRELPRLDMAIFAVTSPEDLLSALITVSLLKAQQPSLHACLADHGFENFSLRPHLESLKRTGALTSVFDTIIVARDERDVMLASIAERIRNGDKPKGWMTVAESGVEPVSIPAMDAASTHPLSVCPPTEVFAPEGVLLTRLSERRCYWSRCTFCIHNDKYDSRTAPSTAEAKAAVDRIESQFAAGFRKIVFLDEALSPAMLRRLAELLIARGLPARGLRWACRSKMELSHDEDLFKLLRKAGCFEVLFGIESTSMKTLRAMDKLTEGLDRRRVSQILTAAAAAGLGLHLNLIAGFPGESAGELQDSLELVREAGARPNVTYKINPFVVFPGTPVYKEPHRFGLKLERTRGDMQAIFGYRLGPLNRHKWKRSLRMLGNEERNLSAQLGWSAFELETGGQQALRLYFESGHGAIFKSSTANPFAPDSGNPQRTSMS
jgi:hypothetical protein